MSYASAKQRYAEKTTGFEDQPVSHNCFANGCPMAGGISTGGNWVCAYHHQATSDRARASVRVPSTSRPVATIQT
jgi:hypothetical protein